MTRRALAYRIGLLFLAGLILGLAWAGYRRPEFWLWLTNNVLLCT